MKNDSGHTSALTSKMMSDRRRRKKTRVSDAGVATSSSAAAEAAGYSGADRLTDLPDTIRLHILTFLPLKSAIRTGAVSSQWRNLWKQRWTHATSLDLSPDATTDCNTFVEHVDRLLGLHGRRHLDALQIRFHPGPSHRHTISSWLNQAFDCGVEALSLDFSLCCPPTARGPQHDAFRFSFPPCSKPSLALLTLSGLHVSSPAYYFRKFCALEVLNLCNVCITDAVLKRTVASLPCLRILDLRQCPSLGAVMVDTPSINSITITGCPNIYKLRVSSPNLRSLHCNTRYLSTYSFSTELALEDVYMSCSNPGDKLLHCKWVSAFGGLVHVRVLTLCSVSLQYIVESGVNELDEFRCLWKLRELQLLMSTLSCSSLMDIYGFFRLCHFPVLEKLFIELPTFLHTGMRLFLGETEKGETGVCFRNLKMVKIINFKGQNNEMQLVRFLLQSAASLESLVIVAPEELTREEHKTNGVNEYLVALQLLHTQLLLIPKASADAQISLIAQDDNRLRPTHEQCYCEA